MLSRWQRFMGYKWEFQACEKCGHRTIWAVLDKNHEQCNVCGTIIEYTKAQKIKVPAQKIVIPPVPKLSQLIPAPPVIQPSPQSTVTINGSPIPQPPTIPQN